MFESRRRYPWWMLVLAIVGGLSIVGVLVTLFLPLGRRPNDLALTQVATAGSPDFLRALAGGAGTAVKEGGSIELLHNGDEFFPTLLTTLAGAQRSINFLVFIWEPGRASDQIFAVLTERARAGVEVRVLLDGFGGREAPEESIEALRAAGGQVAHFRAARLGKLMRVHKRTHRRAIVIDGDVAFTGGMAVADQWLGNAGNAEQWRDTMVKVTGSLATSVQSAFAAPWTEVTGEILVGDQFFPASAAESGPTHIGLASAPSSEDHPLRAFFVQTFRSAKQRLYINTPYFVPDPTIREAVAERARQGVDVRLLLPDEHTDAGPIRQTSHYYFDELLAAGVRIYEYQPTMIHSKHVVVDGVWSIVGTANMDVRSWELNHENILGVADAAFAGEVERTFLDDLQHSEPIALAAWRERGLWKRLTEWTCRLFSEQY